MKRVLSLGLLCSVVAVCFGSGTEGQDISAIGDVRESSVLSSLLPDSQGSTYLLAFPVDDANNNDQTETVHAGGGGSSETITEKPTSSDKEEEKEEVMTVMLSAGDPKDEGKDEVLIPIQDLQPKEGPKFFPLPPSPIIPFRNKPTYRERKFPFPSPFDKFRPPFLPPMRNLLQSLRREPPSNNKLSPINFLSAASLLRRALSNRLRVLNDRYQPPAMEEKLIPLPLFMPPEPLLPPPPPHHSPPMPMFMPFPTPEPMFMPPFSPLHPLFMLDPPPFMAPPLPLHPALVLPQFMHPFPIAPTPFMLPPPPTFLYHSLPPKRMFHLPPPMSLYHPPPFPPHHRPSLPPPLLPPPFMQHMPSQMSMPEPVNVPLAEPSFMLQNLEEMHSPAQGGSEEDEIVLIPSDGQLGNSEEPAYLLVYPNESELPQNEVTSKRKSLLDLLRPQPSKVRHVIQQTRIITQYKPSLMELLNNQLESSSSSFHKPIFRIMDM